MDKKINAELAFVFSQLREEQLLTIPKEIQEVVSSDFDAEVFSNFDSEKPFTEQELSDETLEILLEAGVDVIDASTDEEGYVRVLAEPSALEAMEEAFAAAGINEFETDEVKLIPSDEVVLTDEKLVKFERLLSMLDEVDDVQKVYHNVKLPEESE
jgi:transcriptional/translational regulatory protein YebC/TACO1